MQTTRMACRAITRRTAEWVGSAAAVAGGYVAIDGPQILRIDQDHCRDLQDEAGGSVEWRADDARRELESYHRLPQGGYVRATEPGQGDDYVMVVPADHPLAKRGYALPAPLIAEISPGLEAAGYSVAGLRAGTEARP